MTEKLVPLEEVARLGRDIVRILGGNPGKFTLQGTNTYLIASGSSTSSASSANGRRCILVDTGEGKPTYAPLLRRVLDGQEARVGSTRYDVSDIVLTHRHHDHVGGLPSVLAMLAERQGQGQDPAQKRPPRIHKYPDPETDDVLHSQLKELGDDMYTSASSGSPIWPLADGDLVSIPDSEDGVQLAGGKEASSLQVVHSPGHTKDHICLVLKEEGVLLTGDHVLGQGTSVFEDLGSYLSSLRKCLNVIKDMPLSSQSHDRSNGYHLYPAHGPVIPNGRDMLEKYLAHRLEREDQVLRLLAKHRHDEEASGAGEAGEDAGAPAWTIPELVSQLYSAYPESLYPAAARGLFLHLRKLGQPDDEAIERGAVSADDIYHGRRVRCIGDAAGANGLAPDVPTAEGEWMRVMELRWSLLAPSPGTQLRDNSDIVASGSSSTPKKGAL